MPHPTFARASLAFALVLSPFATTSAQRVLADIPYVPGGSEAQRLDLYLPASRNFATLIAVHGGSLTSGSRTGDSLPAICRNVAARGVACASIGYRLGPTHRWPSQPQDVAAAIHWVRHNIAAHGGDSTRIVLLGHSSGCFLVSLVSTDGRYLSAHALDESAVRGTAAMGCGLAPLLPAISDSVRLRAIFTTGGLSTFGSLEAFLEANPTSFASRRTPPFLILLADAELTSPPLLEPANTFVQRMTALGRRATVQVLPDRRHTTALTSMANPDDPTLGHLMRFIEEVAGSLP